MQERGKLTFAVGLPRSGKSTYANEWVREQYVPLPLKKTNEYPFIAYVYAPIERPRVVVAGDDFRYGVHGHNFIPQSEGLVFAAMDVAASALLHRGFDVILDETCTTEATLLRYLRIDLDATPVFIDTPKEVCIERAIAGGKPYLVGPIERMARQLSELKARWDETVERLRSYLLSRKPDDVTC